MAEVPVQIEEIYKIYKQTKSVRLPFNLPINKIDHKIDHGDLYFTLDIRSRKGIRGFLINSLRLVEFYMPFLLKPCIPLLKKYVNNNLYIYGGNAYAKEAIKKGANYAVIDSKLAKKGDKFLFVNNTRDTLINLVALNRNNVNTQFVGITGSCGKTTTKELTKYILSKKYSTESTPKSANAFYTIAYSLLNFNESTDLAVIEMGIDSPGQIKKYCELVQPQCGLITCIGKAHLQGLKSIEGVLKAKGELFEYLISVNGHIFKNINDSRIASLAKNYKNITTYGRTKDANICGEIISAFPFLKIKWYPPTKARAEYYNVSTKLFGEYNLDNLLAAISVALHYDVPPKLINEAIQEYETLNLRSQIKNIGTNKIIFDCYNANPTSMRASLINFSKMNADKKVLLIGDMLELGNSSIQEHSDMISFVKKLNFDLAVFIGKEFMKARDNDFGLYLSNVRTARKWFHKQKFENTQILLKASRGIAIEKMINK
jgi:UDP-N-acetylmuramoyl-tripeptide--D-alanyl-D-alanine ligase